MDRIRNTLVRLRGQLWLIPLVMSILALAFASWILSSGSAVVKEWDDTELWWLYGGDTSSARDLLSSLLSGLMTMTSLVVSMTFVILTLAANQLGPRLITTFMADRQIQAVLGLFLGTILYVLVVLRSLDETLGTEGVPHIAVTIGSGLTVVCLFALLFYVHKIAGAIIADNIVARVANDLHANIHGILPKETGDPERPSVHSAQPRAGSLSLERSGYIQVIDYDKLVSVASAGQCVLDLKIRAGHFVFRSGEHVIVHGLHPLEQDAADAVRSAFLVGEQRSPAQDLEFGIRQLVEIALRALSPGINDPYTAVAVIDRLGAGLEDIMHRSLKPSVLYDEGGDVRVLAQRSDIQGMMDAAFDPIRQSGNGMPTVLIRMADVLGQLAPAGCSGEARDAVVSHLGKLAETAEAAAFTPSDRRAVLQRVEHARIAVSTRFGAEGCA